MIMLPLMGIADSTKTCLFEYSTLLSCTTLKVCISKNVLFFSENFVFGFLIFTTIFYQVLALKTDISLVGKIHFLEHSAILLAYIKGLPVLKIFF